MPPHTSWVTNICTYIIKPCLRKWDAQEVTAFVTVRLKATENIPHANCVCTCPCRLLSHVRILENGTNEKKARQTNSPCRLVFVRSILRVAHMNLCHHLLVILNFVVSCYYFASTDNTLRSSAHAIHGPSTASAIRCLCRKGFVVKTSTFV